MNPFGIIYNPDSLANSLMFLIQNKCFSQEDLLQHNNLWFSLDHHSRFNGQNAEDCLEKINGEIIIASPKLIKADYVFITLGTAIVYHHIRTEKIAANCHKLPSAEFRRTFLSVEEIVQSFEKPISLLKKINPAVKFIFTISPVRHWSEGAVDNQLSKSILFVAINQLMKITENVSYFPAYELLLDDLRDYRFYKQDMIHPNESAIEYIWVKFMAKYFDASASELVKYMDILLAAANHRPFWPDSDDHKRFLNKNLEIIKKVKEKFPHADLKDMEMLFQ